MALDRTLDVLNRMVAEHVIGRYAIAGAVAAYYYIEPTLTNDLDVLLILDGQAARGLVLLAPVLNYLQAAGYTEFRNEGVLVEGWPVQFLPVADALDADALANALDIETEVGGRRIATVLLRPEYLVALALKVGRRKDHVRILQFVEAERVDALRLRAVLAKHHLLDTWRSFCGQFSVGAPYA